MSALNKTETEALRAVEKVIGFVLRDGYRPENLHRGSITSDPRSKELKLLLERSKKSVHTVVEMKGYYPK